MDSSQRGVCYCSVSKGGRVLYTYTDGNREIENLAALCLDKAPPYHRWYCQTVGKKTFCFLMEDGYVYFAISEESLGNGEILRFLQNLRHEFRKFSRSGSGRSISSLSSVQEQLVPVIRSLISSLENVSGVENVSASSFNDVNGQTEGSSSTRAPLLSKCDKKKKKKKKKKEHAIAIELEEHRKSTDRVRADSGSRDCASNSPALQKDFGSGRLRPSNQNIQKKWCRLVRIILAADAIICIVLLVIWLVVCEGTKCIN